MAQFTLFSRLPPEIRDEIWHLCLPRRILELDYPILEGCGPEYTTWENGRPPVLARVCREARRVALAHGEFKHLPLSPSPVLEVRHKFWHQVYLDSVHLNLLSCYGSVPVQGKTPLSDALVRCWNMATPLSFTRDRFHQYGMLVEEAKAAGQAALTRRTGETFRVVFLIIPIHLTAAQVTSSGLFGHLGDEIIKLVDLDAFDVIEKYRRLFHASKRQPKNVQSLFDALAPSSAWREPLPRWQQTVQAMLLSAACNTWDETNQSPELDTFWLQTWSLGPSPLGSGHSIYLEPRYFVGQDRRWVVVDGRDIPNYENPLVKRLIAQFPEFRPTVMFRACTDDRCEERLDDEVVYRKWPLTLDIQTAKIWPNYTTPDESD